MSLTVALRVAFQGREAQTGTRGLATEVRALDTATKGAATSATRTEAATRRLSAAQVAAAQSSRDLHQSQTLAAGSVGNLAAQFNDIGMMMAAGQNPLMLAIQQGTQITQVLGPMGAGGAVRALGAAFGQMLSPINLVTLAGIAMGTALVQWLFDAGEEAASFEEAISEVERGIGRLNELNASLTLEGIVKLKEKYGEVNAELLLMIQRQREATFDKTLANAKEAAAALRDEFDLGSMFAAIDASPLEDLDIVAMMVNDSLGLTIDQARELQAAFEAVSAAETPQQLASALAEVSGLLAESKMKANELAIELLNGEDTARLLAAAAPSGNWMDAAIGGVGSLIGKLWEAVGAANSLAAAQARGKNNVQGGRGADPRTFVTDPYWKAKYFPDPTNAPKKNSAGAGGGGGGGGAKAEADAIGKLIQKHERELELLRETDPVKKEMLRLREQLSTATTAEKQRIEELIAARIDERAAMDGLHAATKMAGEALIDALMGGKDAGEQLIKTLMNAGLQAALLGQGPLAGLFGGGEKGGFLGMLTNLIMPQRKAGGGFITGPGTTTSDSIPAMLSDGEFVVNARATGRNRRLLEAINSGADLPRFARGGYAGGSVSAAAATGTMRPAVTIINNSPEPIREQPGDGPDAEAGVTLIVGRQTARGKFDRQNRARFGLSPKVTSR